LHTGASSDRPEIQAGGVTASRAGVKPEPATLLVLLPALLVNTT